MSTMQCNARSISQQSIKDLNSEFSFSKTSCHTKFKEPSLFYYLPIGERGKNIWLYTFLKGIKAMRNKQVVIFPLFA